MKTEGRFMTFLGAAVTAGFCVMGLLILLQQVFGILLFLATRQTVIAVFAIATIISIVLAKRGFYEKTRDYIATLDENSLKAMRRRYGIIVIAAGSVYMVAMVILLIKNLHVFY